MFEKLNNLVEVHNNYMERMRADGLKALKSGIGEFFEAHPEVARLSWTQCSPYFNDGEACEFRVNEIGVYFNDDVSAQYLRTVLADRNINHGEYVYDDVSYSSSRKNPETGLLGDEALVKLFAGIDAEGFDDYEQCSVYSLRDSQLKEDMSTLQGVLHAIEDVLEGTLGNHVQIVCTPEGIEVEEYEHD
jgi:hypothetical protein